MNALRAFLNFLRTASVPVQLLGVATIGVVVYLLISSGAVPFLKGKTAETTPSAKTTRATNTQTVTVIANGVATPLDYPTKDGRPEKPDGTANTGPVNIDALNQKEGPCLAQSALRRGQPHLAIHQERRQSCRLREISILREI